MQILPPPAPAITRRCCNLAVVCNQPWNQMEISLANKFFPTQSGPGDILETCTFDSPSPPTAHNKTATTCASKLQAGTPWSACSKPPCHAAWLLRQKGVPSAVCTSSPLLAGLHSTASGLVDSSSPFLARTAPFRHCVGNAIHPQFKQTQNTPCAASPTGTAEGTGLAACPPRPLRVTRLHLTWPGGGRQPAPAFKRTPPRPVPPAQQAQRREWGWPPAPPPPLHAGPSP